ncbi:hypothetical protein DMUE_6246 [Dictyocoela muelleri]|nr:hypothetical protein DMUE_6246 [Dictyocoela muelleri]
MGISTAGKGPCSNMKTTDLMPDERDCRYYYVCSPKRDRPMAHLQCPNNMYFSPTAKACTHEYVVSFTIQWIDPSEFRIEFLRVDRKIFPFIISNLTKRLAFKSNKDISYWQN